jgi:hypothetical protein
MAFAPVAALALGGIGAATSAYGAISGANATAANANYQAQVARNNAITAAQNAEYTTQAGQEKAQQSSLQARSRLGAVTTGLAANGIDVNSGSAVAAQQTQREVGTLGTQQVVDNAALQAYGYRTQATSDTAQATLDTQEAQQAPIAGGLSAAGGLLGSAASVGSNYAMLQRLGGGFNNVSGGINSLDNVAMGNVY